MQRRYDNHEQDDEGEQRFHNPSIIVAGRAVNFRATPVATVKIDLASLIIRKRRWRRAVFVARPIFPTGAQRQALERVYLRVVREWGVRLRDSVMPEYQRTLAATGGVRDSVDDVQGKVDEATAALTRLVLTLNAALEDWIVRVEEWHRGQFARSFTPAGVSLDTMLGRGDVVETLRSVLAENTALIRSLDEQMRNGISGAVFRGLTDRSTAADVAREIQAVTGVARRRAQLIAADQIQKLTGRLDQERQRQVGLNRFMWRHSHKKNPRPEHVVRDGKIYSWDSEVAKSDPPGRKIRCGCRAQAVVDLKAAMAADVGAD